MLKWTLIVILGLAGLVGLVAIVGTILPKGHRASKTATFTSPPASVYAAITDPARYPEWRADVTAVEILPDDGGGLRFREVGSNGTITFRFERLEPPHRVVARIADPTLPFGGSWTYELRPAGAGTELTITEDGEVYNPIFRVISKLMSQTATIEKYLASLEKRLAQ